MGSQTIKSVVDQAIEQAKGVRGLAKQLGTSHSTVSGWTSGSCPSARLFEDMLKYLGGDIERALPDYDPETAPSMQVLGRVAAGGEAVVYEDLELVHPQKDVWEHSSAAPLGFGPVQYMRVEGESMEPDYPRGCLIAVRRSTLKPWNVPHLSPVILVPKSAHDSATFKLVQVKRDANDKPTQVLGVPINRSYDVLFWGPEEVGISHVVLGKVEVFKPGVRYANGKVFQEDEQK